MLFRLKEKCGHHVEDGKIYKSGDIIETERDLPTIFHGKDAKGRNRSGKFERVHENLKDTGTKDTSRIQRPNIPPGVSPKQKTKVANKESAHGEDVTSEFPTAEKVEVKVFEKSRWFTVIDTQDDSILNEKKLRRKEVELFLEQYLDLDISDGEGKTPNED